MDKTLTIRLDSEQDKALTQRAKAHGKTRSELVRSFIELGLEEKPMGQRIGHLKGILDLPVPREARRRRIKARNWR